LSGIPALARWFRKKAFQEVRDKLFGESICFMITGGGCIGKEVLEFFNGIGYHLSNGYGMSEVGITSVELSEDNRILNSGTIGKPMSSVSYKINEEGELFVKGNSLCKYYLENDEKVYIKDEWFKTKDLAKEENGRYFLVGRKDDLIVSTSGENINPNLFEHEFNIKHVKGVCIVDVKKNGQAYPVILVSVVKYLSNETRVALTQEIKEKLKKLNLLSEIKEVVLVGEDLIKGNEFKLNRKRLAEEHNKGTLNVLTCDEQGGDAYIFDAIEKQVAACFEKVLGKTIDKNVDFFTDAGGTSLDYFTLIAYIQDEFDIIIPLGNDKKLSSISDFSAFIKGNM
jgi:long-chain acyl-CoA synthetase